MMLFRRLLVVAIAFGIVTLLGCSYVVNPQHSSESMMDKAGAPMALIPAGDFQMGSNHDESERPVHTVYLDAFYIDKYEVTNAQYRKFIEATGHKEPRFWHDPDFNPDNRPVTGVTWHDAAAYCEWAGKRLPTEAEWEKAGRGGMAREKYPWGSGFSHDYANFVFTDGKDIWNRVAPVGSFPPNSYGLYDMAGNIMEWCADWYNVDYYMESPEKNPIGPSSGEDRVTRGGSWTCHPDNAPDLLRVAKRDHYPPESAAKTIGFRCAKDAAP